MEQLTKLRPPHCNRVLHRTRLFTKIDTSLKYPVTWISGSSGAGKTTLVSSYLECEGISPLWFQVDEGDSDPAAFFYHLGLLAQGFNPDLEPLPLLTPEYVHGIPVFARNFLHEFYTRLPENSVLVLDNFQDAGVDNPLESLLPLFLNELPASIRIIILSRSIPPNNLAPQLKSGDIQTLNWQHLQFTEQEVDDLVKLHNRAQSFSQNEIPMLHQNTQGWAASLILMMEQPFDKEQPVFTEGRTKEAVFDYFASELLQRCSQEVTSFLLQTAVFKNITVAAVEKLTANPRCHEILEELAQGNYFTSKCFGTPIVFQYHPIFREFLLTQAKQMLKPERLTELRILAADILLSQNNIPHGADLLIRAQHWEKLLEVILNNAKAMIKKGQVSTLRHWISSLPEQMQAQNNWVCYWRGFTEISITPSVAINHFQNAYQISQEQDDLRGQILSWCGAINAYVFAWGEVKTLDKWILDLDAIVLLSQKLGDSDLQEQVDYASYLALMWRQPEHKKMQEYEEKVWHIVMHGSNIETRIQAAGQLLFYLTWWRGEFEKAEILVQTMRPIMDQQQISPLVKIAWHTMLGNYYATVFKEDDCLENIRTGIELSDSTGIYIWKSCLYDQACFLSLHKGKTDKSTYYIEQLHKTRQFGGEGHEAMYHVFRAWYEMNDGNATAAKENILIAQKIASNIGVYMFEKIINCCYARYLLMEGEHDLARELVRKHWQNPLKSNAKSLVFLSYIVEAEYHLAINDRKACIAILGDLLSITKIYSAFWWRDQNFSKFCSIALQNGIEEDYVKEIIARHRLLPMPGYETELWPYPVKIYTLGSFRLVINDEQMEFGSRAPKKPLELIKALITFGCENVADTQIMEALWPDAEGDAAYDSLRTTVKRLRSLFNEKKAITFIDGKLSLNPDYCWVDSYCFEVMCQQKESDNEQMEKALSLYAGHFMANDNEHWMLSMRDKLHQKFVRATCLLAENHQDQEQWQMAIDVYLRGLNVAELTEGFYQGLMRCYHQVGQTDQIEKLFHQLHQFLDAKLSLTPSSETRKLYNELTNVLHE